MSNFFREILASCLKVKALRRGQHSISTTIREEKEKRSELFAPCALDTGCNLMDRLNVRFC